MTVRPKSTRPSGRRRHGGFLRIAERSLFEAGCVVAFLLAAVMVAAGGSLPVLSAYAGAAFLTFSLVTLQNALLPNVDGARSLARTTAVWGFVVRVASGIGFAALLGHLYGMPFVGFSDDYSFELTAEMLAGNSGDFFARARHPGYVYVLTRLHEAADAIGGYHFLIPRLFNAGIGAALAAAIVRAVEWARPGPKSVGLLAGLSVFMPEFLYYSSLTLRDIVISYLWMLVLIVAMSTRSAGVRAVVIACAVSGMWTMRITYGVFLAVLGSAALFPRRARGGVSARAVLMTLFVMLVGMGVYLPRVDRDAPGSGGSGTGRVSSEFAVGVAIATRAEPLMGRKAVSGLQTMLEVLPMSIRPVFFAVFQLFTPVPFWRVGGSNDAFDWLFCIQGGLWVLIACATSIVLVRLLKHGRMAAHSVAMLLFAAVPVIASGVTTGIARYRLPAVGPILVLLFVHFDVKRDGGRLRRLAGALVAVSVVWEIIRVAVLSR